MLSSAFPYIIHLQSSWDLSIFAFTKFVLHACSCAPIIRVSVSLFRLLSISHNHLSLSANSSVCLRNCPYKIFSFHLLFRSCRVLLLNSFSVSISVFSVSPLAAIISSSLLFLIYLYRPILARLILSSMLVSPLPPSFLGIYILSTSLRGCSPLCIVKSFLVLRSINWSSAFVQLRKAAEYLNTGIANVLVPLMMFPPFNFVSRIFLTLLLYSLLTFHFLFLHCIYLQYAQILVSFSILQWFYLCIIW